MGYIKTKFDHFFHIDIFITDVRSLYYVKFFPPLFIGGAHPVLI